MSLTGYFINPFQIGPLMGQGSFGEIYAARDTSNNSFVALKIEPISQRRHVLEIEASILRKISQYPYFPRYISFGRTKNNTYLAMELCGPSLSYTIKRLPTHKLTLSSGIRTIDVILKGLELLHLSGIIHRDVKPSNILLRQSPEYPVAIIDFGLSRVFVDKETKKQLPPRSNPGFRGTAIFASPNAHLHMELSPRDDLISWYYMSIDMILGPLPWRHIENRADILQKKRSTDMAKLGSKIAPEFADIWKHISSLRYDDMPNYDLLHTFLHKICINNNINQDDKYDWDPVILRINDETNGESPERSTLSSEASVHEEVEQPMENYGTSRFPKQVDPTPLLMPRSTKAETNRTGRHEENDCGCCKI